MPKIEVLPKLLKARQQFAFGDQKGNKEKPGCIVIISNGDEGYKGINLGKDNAIYRLRSNEFSPEFTKYILFNII